MHDDTRTPMTKNNGLLLGSGLLLVALLTGCGDKDKQVGSQVLASVNGKEITVLQLNYLLAQQNGLPAAQQKSKQQLLDQLIDQEVLVQKADELKLDRNPNVLQALEFSRRQVLAQAVAAQELNLTGEPADAALKAFYDAHPQRFAQRQIFTLANFLIPAEDISTSAQSALDKATDAEQLRDILKQQGYSFSENHSEVPAEKLPDVLLDKLVTIAPGDIVKLKQGQQVLLIQLEQRTPSPISLEKAKPQLVSLVKQSELREQAEQKMVQLRQAAKVEYRHRFADEAESESKPVTTDTAAQAGTEHLEQGLKGLQ
ncbi:hypothetical protein GCM10023095_00830 [Pseudaeromonas paramecii]|uniref:peptidylprolyl isomerase n=2 Tax=Pseudaeromonas paramecii TaxID=2138166 RepID=A0ABP8PV09_9GAMM